jgi:hypothetical protein
VTSAEALAEEEAQVVRPMKEALCLTEELLAGAKAKKEEDPAAVALYQSRLATIHHRLGSLWHHGLRQVTCSEQCIKNYLLS